MLVFRSVSAAKSLPDRRMRRVDEFSALVETAIGPALQGACSDRVRQAQEAVELASKGIPRQSGIEPYGREDAERARVDARLVVDVASRCLFAT